MISRLSTKIAIAAATAILILILFAIKVLTPSKKPKPQTIDDDTETLGTESATTATRKVKPQEKKTSLVARNQKKIEEVNSHKIASTSSFFELDFTPIAPSLKNQVWTPLVCMPGTLLNSAKFLANCNAGKVVPKEVFCPASSDDDDKNQKPLCGQYSAGEFLRPLLQTSFSLHQKSACSLKAHLEDKIDSSRWFFDENDSLKLKSKSCDFEYFSPQQLFSALVSKSSAIGSKSQSLTPMILFSGDSMTRQIFLRLISLLRNQLEEPIVEHYFHFDAVYFIFGGKYDVLIPIGMPAKIAASTVPPFLRKAVAEELVRLSILTSKSPVVQALLSSAIENEKSFFGGASSRNAAPTLAMMYQWETKPSKFRKDVMSLKPKIHVAAWMYWWQKKDPLSDFNGYEKAMDKYHQSLQSSSDDDKSSIYVYVTTPWTKEGIFGGVDDTIRNVRNSKAVDWLRRSSTTSSSDGVSKILLDYSAIADLKKFAKTKDEIHYMCIWQPKLPGAVMEQKFVAENGCVDKMNAAVAQVLVHSLMGV